MSKQILILAGSPRRNGNTDILAAEFAKTAQENGHTTDLFRVADLKIGGCLACEHCWDQGELPCVQKDDMQQLFPLLNTADVVVFVTPLYYFGFSSQLKATIDRFYPFSMEGKADAFANKQCALIVCGASEEESDFDAITQHYETLVDYLGWEDCGAVSAVGLCEKDEAATGPWLEAVRALAKEL